MERRVCDMAAPKIEKVLTPYNYTNKDNTGRIKYIVIHYVGALGGAEENCKYYASKYLGASAHYFVGFDGEIWQSVEDGDIAWHCGASTYKHAECRNSNSIGIEMCVRSKGSQSATSKDWYFEQETVDAAIELTRYLMKKYNVPADHVIRHYDVTGKICPNPYVYNSTKHVWDAFVKTIKSKASEIGKDKTANSKGVPYMINTTCDILRIRKEPNTNSQVMGRITETKGDKKKYTIIEERNGWGRLKSGAGWISLKYTKKVS